MHWMALEMPYVRGLIYAANQSKKSIQTLCTFLATTLYVLCINLEGWRGGRGKYTCNHCYSLSINKNI
jgi:hypothetical protein